MPGLLQPAPLLLWKPQPSPPAALTYDLLLARRRWGWVGTSGGWGCVGKDSRKRRSGGDWGSHWWLVVWKGSQDGEGVGWAFQVVGGGACGARTVLIPTPTTAPPTQSRPAAPPQDMRRNMQWVGSGAGDGNSSWLVVWEGTAGKWRRGGVGTHWWLAAWEGTAGLGDGVGVGSHWWLVALG